MLGMSKDKEKLGATPTVKKCDACKRENREELHKAKNGAVICVDAKECLGYSRKKGDYLLAYTPAQ